MMELIDSSASPAASVGMTIACLFHKQTLPPGRCRVGEKSTAKMAVAQLRLHVHASVEHGTEHNCFSMVVVKHSYAGMGVSAVTWNRGD